MNQPTAEQLETEIAWLDTFGAPVVEYATKRIAHHDEDPTVFPSLDDVDNFIEYSGRTVLKVQRAHECDEHLSRCPHQLRLDGAFPRRVARFSRLTPRPWELSSISVIFTPEGAC